MRTGLKKDFRVSRIGPGGSLNDKYPNQIIFCYQNPSNYNVFHPFTQLIFLAPFFLPPTKPYLTKRTSALPYGPSQQ